MIPAAAIKKYLDRPLDNHLWIKAAARAELRAAISQLKPRPRLHRDLRPHQLGCFLLGVAYPQFAFWLDMGTGKTLIALELLKYWRQCGQLRRALIFITSDKAFPTWRKQIKRFNIDVPYTLLEGSSQQKWATLDEFGDGLVLVSYPGAVSMVSTAVPKANGKTKWRLDPAAVARLAEGVGAIVMDESTRASGYSSLTHELMDRLGRTASVRYALAGRPFGRDPTLLWAQHYLVDGGETLGPTLGLFRAAFFVAKKNYWGGPYSYDYIFKANMKGKLSSMIQHRSIAYAAEECIEVPEFVPIIEEVSFAEEAAAYYRRAVQEIIKAKKDFRAVKSIFLRMRQISSGFLGFHNDETGEKAEVEFDENPKFDRLMELLDCMPSDRKAVCFYDYTWSGRKIASATKAFKPIWLWSGTKDYKADLARFEQDQDCRLAVVNNKVGAFSLDGLQVANFLFIYESPVGCIEREQMERRLRRQGQKYKVFQYDLVVTGSVDLRILEYHKQGADLIKAILQDPDLLL